MNILFFDCETTGVPKDYKASYTEVDNWPRVISLAWILATSEGEIIRQNYAMIYPDGWTMPIEKFWVDNGYTQEKSELLGVPIIHILEKFKEDKLNADILCAHNLNFDHRIVWAEFIRAGIEPRSGMHKICTMMKSTSHCRIPQANGRGFKWPKLEELYKFLFNKDMENAHDALADITATKECFFELVARQVITIPSPAEIAALIAEKMPKPVSHA
jgi:DNA polymerase-3 subunit epsilon